MLVIAWLLESHRVACCAVRTAPAVPEVIHKITSRGSLASNEYGPALRHNTGMIPLVSPQLAIARVPTAPASVHSFARGVLPPSQHASSHGVGNSLRLVRRYDGAQPYIAE